jgi:hypothetical protein
MGSSTDISKSEAEQIAKQQLQALSKKVNEHNDPDEELVVLVVVPELTIEKPYGWVFFYDSEAHLQGVPGSGLGGNAPFLVERDGGAVRALASNRSVKKQLAEYETKLREKART